MDTLMYSGRGLFIAGALRQYGGSRGNPVHDPATSEVLGTAPAASAQDTQEAIESAVQGFATWSATPTWARAEILHRVADAMIARSEEAARVITQEAGKPLAQSRRKWQLSIDQFRWYAKEARRIYRRILESRAPGGMGREGGAEGIADYLNVKLGHVAV